MPLPPPPAIPGPIGRARLYQAAGGTLQPQARARLLQASLDRARHQGGYLLAAQVDMAYLLPLTPAPELAWFAGDAGRALYATGHYEQANAWLEMARARGNPQTAAAVSALAVYARIAGVGPALSWDPASLEKWRQSRRQQRRGAAPLRHFRGPGRAHGRRLVLDRPTGRGCRRRQGPRSRPAVRSRATPPRRIASARRCSSPSMPWGPRGRRGCNPLALSRVITGLRQIGLDSEARAIAMEAAIAAGV